MKHSIVNNFKLWITLTLSVIVAGLAVLGFLGFNNAIADKPYYEVSISVDQDVKSSAQITEKASRDFFDINGIPYASYSVQKTGLNTKFIFKFDRDVSEAILGLEEYVEAQINDVERSVEVKLYKADNKVNVNIVKILALALALIAVVFIVSAISYKIKSAIAVVLSSIVSAISFISIIALTRLPASPFIAINGFASLILSVALSLLVINGYAEIQKLAGNDKLSNAEIADASIKAKLLPILTFAAVLLAISVGICFGLGYSLFLALQILAVNVCATYSAIVITPLLLFVLKK